jgi:hypothetical protein
MKNVSMNQANYQSTKPFASGFVQARGWREGIQAPQVKLKWMQVIETCPQGQFYPVCLFFSSHG